MIDFFEAAAEICLEAMIQAAAGGREGATPSDQVSTQYLIIIIIIILIIIIIINFIILIIIINFIKTTLM